MTQNKGQGSLEYLLILGGAILVAVIVIAAITMLPNGSTTTLNAVAASCQTAATGSICVGITATGVSVPATATNCASGGDTICCWSAAVTAEGTCSINPAATVTP